MDITQFRDPIEVWKAALGNTEPLSKRLRSSCAIYELERIAIDLLIAGKLKPPKRYKKVPPKPSLAEWVTQPIPLKIRRDNALFMYKYYMDKLCETRQAYGNSHKVIEYVAEQEGVAPETLHTDIRRQSGRAPKSEERSQLSYDDYVLQKFRTWCFQNWEEVQHNRSRKR